MVEIIIVFCACFVILGAALFVGKRPIEKEKATMRESDKKVLSALLIEKAKQMRSSSSSGQGVDAYPLYRGIERCYKAIERKAERKHSLDHAEKWVYENFYLCAETALGFRDDMSSLPHVNGEVRIIELARVIADNSLGDLTPERIKYILSEIKGVLALTFMEIRSFNDAMAFAILERIYFLSQRIEYQYECYEKSKEKKLCEKMISRDVYLYYLFKNTSSEKIVKELQKRGINEKDTELNYNLVQMKNTMMAETLFGALVRVRELLPLSLGMKYLGAYRTLSRKYNLEKVDTGTLCEYFSRIERCAKKCNVSEEYVAQKLIEYAQKTKKDISVVLLDDFYGLKKYILYNKVTRRKHLQWKEWIYVCIIILVSVGVSVGMGLILRSVVFGIFSFIPILFLADIFVNYMLIHSKSGFIPPSMNASEVGYENSTTVVISEFIGSMEQLKKSLFHARTILEGNRDDNVSVALLLDTKGGDMPVSDLDREIIDYLETVRLDEKINVFIRKKSFKGDRFVAKERKRGAIMALCKFFVMREEFDFLYIGKRDVVTPTYLVTLDADNELLPGEVLSLVNKASHPYSAKYDLLTLQGRYNLYSIGNLYSMRYLSDAGFEGYPMYGSLFYKLFQRDIFCGKGIFRLKSFYNKLNEIFPSGKILSHDVLEGSVLSTGAGGMCFEDAPDSFLSERERRKRWLRGDIQLLPFLFGRWKNDEGECCKKHISPLATFVMAKNILYALKDIFLLVLLLYGISVSTVATLCALGLFVAPYAVNAIRILRGTVHKEKYSLIGKNILFNFLFMAEDFFSLGYYAVDNLLTICATFWKMVRKKDLLEWKTFYSSQNKRRFSSYVCAFSLPTLVLTGISAVLFLLGNSYILFVLVYILCFLCVGVMLFIESRLPIKEKTIREEKKEKLKGLAERTYRYFRLLAQSKALPGDNVQWKPYLGIAKVTSPTDIAFALLAEVCAYHLGYISAEECVFSIGKQVDEICDLPKWNGNLYNWYDTEKRVPVNPFVSSVDNGNLLAVLLLTAAFLRSEGEGAEEMKIRLLLKEFRIEKLYDKTKHLFYIGFDGKNYTGHYDLLASESRILSFVYIALFHDYTHYSSLKKELCGRGGNILYSWSGTMFEMLMADIFFPLPYGSLLKRSAQYTVRKQSHKKLGGVWGISESGYHEFDSDMKYQYKAFGLKELSLRSEREEDVITPYASLLALRYAPDKVYDNMERLEKLGASYEYGLYESIDFSDKKEIVYSSMTHHQGMILASLTNFLCDNVLQKTMLSDPKLYAVTMYCNDVQPKVRILSKTREKNKKYAENNQCYYKICAKIDEYYTSYGITNKDYSVVCTSFGGGYSKIRDIYVGKKPAFISESDGIFFAAKKGDGTWHSPTFLPFYNGETDFEVSCTGEEVFYDASNGLHEKITVIPTLQAEVRSFTAEGDYKKAAIYFDVCLDRVDDYVSHPAFRDMFVYVEPIQPNMILLSKRIPHGENRTRFLAVRLDGMKNIKWDCNRLSSLGRGRDISCAKLFSDEENSLPKFGDVLYPCVSAIGEFNDKRSTCELIILYGTDRREVIENIVSLPHNAYAFATLSSQKYALHPFTQDILGEVLYAPRDRAELSDVIRQGHREEFMHYCDGKKVLRYSYRSGQVQEFTELCKTLAELRFFTEIPVVEVALDVACTPRDEEFIQKEFTRKDIRQYHFVRVGEKTSVPCIMVKTDLSIDKTKLKCGKHLDAQSKRREPNGRISKPEIAFVTGSGGYDAADAYLVTEQTPMPYSNVIGGRKGGIVATSDGTGFYYFGNSREEKAIRFYNDPISRRSGEYLCIKTDRGYVPIRTTGESGYAEMGRGYVIYHCDDEAFLSCCKETILCDGEIKMTEVNIVNKTGKELEFLYLFYPSLYWKYVPDDIVFTQESDLITVTNIRSGKKVYTLPIGVSGGQQNRLKEEEEVPYFSYSFDENEWKGAFLFSENLPLLLSISEENIDLLKNEIKSYFAEKKVIDVVTNEKSFEKLVNMLPYQILSSRLNAKAGFYQVGGATGFRDQLQDSLAFFTHPELIKERIEACCLHQYEGGDVMHWWHYEKFGLRTKITDDKLFLPYAIAQYCQYSGDKAFLDEEFPYLRSEPLAPEEKDRFENPPYTSYKESVFKHCLRAIRSSLRYGEHGLLVMGTGDWNDGMDEICSEGNGESVFNSMLCHLVLNEFAELCPEELKKELYTIAVELKKAVNLHAYEEGRYKRLFSDDGRWLGSKHSPTLTLDLLTQAFAVLSGVAEGERAVECLRSAEELIDRKNGLIKLLTPPQTRKDRLGYISDYPQGVRENGGQYTHAVMWYLIALTRVGKQDEAFELFQLINPVEKCKNKVKSEQYACEPYVLCGDVYSNPGYEGKGGWSWYTGSAAWAYKLVTEEFYGLHRKGEYLYIQPRLPEKLEGSTVVYRYKNSSYFIEYRRGILSKVTVEGEKTSGIMLRENERKNVVVEIGY